MESPLNYWPYLSNFGSCRTRGDAIVIFPSNTLIILKQNILFHWGTDLSRKFSHLPLVTPGLVKVLRRKSTEVNQSYFSPLTQRAAFVYISVQKKKKKKENTWLGSCVIISVVFGRVSFLFNWRLNIHESGQKRTRIVSCRDDSVCCFIVSRSVDCHANEVANFFEWNYSILSIITSSRFFLRFKPVETTKNEFACEIIEMLKQYFIDVRDRLKHLLIYITLDYNLSG